MSSAAATSGPTPGRCRRAGALARNQVLRLLGQRSHFAVQLAPPSRQAAEHDTGHVLEVRIGRAATPLAKLPHELRHTAISEPATQPVRRTRDHGAEWVPRRRRARIAGWRGTRTRRSISTGPSCDLGPWATVCPEAQRAAAAASTASDFPRWRRICPFRRLTSTMVTPAVGVTASG